MKTVIILAAIFLSINAMAQVGTSNLIEGGKAVIELLKVIKTPKQPSLSANLQSVEKDCEIKHSGDACFKNSLPKAITITLHNKQDSDKVLSLKVGSASSECLYSIPSGIYHVKADADNLIIQEGDIRIEDCQNFLKEIKP